MSKSSNFQAKYYFFTRINYELTPRMRYLSVKFILIKCCDTVYIIIIKLFKFYFIFLMIKNAVIILILPRQRKLLVINSANILLNLQIFIHFYKDEKNKVFEIYNVFFINLHVTDYSKVTFMRSFIWFVEKLIII